MSIQTPACTRKANGSALKGTKGLYTHGNAQQRKSASFCSFPPIRALLHLSIAVERKLASGEEPEKNSNQE